MGCKTNVARAKYDGGGEGSIRKWMLASGRRRLKSQLKREGEEKIRLFFFFL